MISSKAALFSFLATTATVTAQTNTPAPTENPTDQPTDIPTDVPTDIPTSSPTVLIGCPPLWQTGDSGSYAAGELVSHPESESGDDILAVYECKTEPYNLYCPQIGFEPGTYHAPTAWTRLGNCNSLVDYVSPTTSPSSIPTTSPTFSLWDLEGCPPSFDIATPVMYEEVVEFEGVVYECTSAFQGRCNQAGWEPGMGVEWESAWVVLGRCEGTIVPTTSPSGQAWEKEGCPDEYSAGTSYEEGEAVESFGSVFECLAYPYTQLCGMAGYEPGVGTIWDAAWERLGTCSGTLSPTSLPTAAPSKIPTGSPTFPAWELEGCPMVFSEEEMYGEGDVVERDGLVFECKEGGTAPHCGQAGYEPGTGQVWDTAWTILGSCTGTIAPTVAVTIEKWEREGCPEEYAPSPTTYADASLVSLNGVVYQCKPHPDTGFCNIHSPDSDYGYLGWVTLGSCAGTLAPTSIPTASPSSFPTSSPTYPEWEKGGCPEAFDESLTTVYTEGQVVASNGVVYECKMWPQTARCNQDGWQPGMGDFWTEAWEVLGSCDGTIIPTAMPTRQLLPLWDEEGCPNEYDAAIATTYKEGSVVSAYGLRVFECKPFPDTGFCKLYGPEEENGELGWTVIGGCTGTIAPTIAPTEQDFSGCSTPEYSAGATYEEGDEVHVGGDVYECKPFPFSLWCSNPGYIPGTPTGAEAWSSTGQSC